jgi:hypothetical protein
MSSETIERVITAIVDNRTRFEAWCRSLSEEQMNRPVPDSTWVVRDFIAHLGTLDPMMERWFRDAAGGQADFRRGADGGSFDIDHFNDAEVAARRAWPLDRVFNEAAANRERLIDALRALTDETIERNVYFGGDAKRRPGEFALKLFLSGWAQHDPIHVADMLKALPELADDPDLRAWIDNPFVAGYQAAMSRPPRDDR